MFKNNKTNAFTLFTLILVFLLPVFLIPSINNPFVNTKGILLFFLALGTLATYIVQSFKEKKWLISSNPLVLPLILFAGSILLSSLVTHQYPFDQLVGWGGFFLSFATIIVFAPTLIKKDHSQKLIQVLNVAGLIIVFGSILQLFGFGFSQIFNQLSVFEFPNNLSFSLSGGVLLNIQLLSALIMTNVLSKNQRSSILQKTIIATLVIGLGINIYAALPSQETSPILLPLPASIAIARESLVVSRTALFGFGPNSYGQAFHLLKPAWLNTSEFWQLSFESATAFPLTLIVSGGLLAFLSWLFFVSRTIALVNIKKTQRAQVLKYFIITAIIWQIILPLNILMLGLLALVISFYLAANLDNYKIKKFSFNNLFDPFNLQPNNKANRYTFTTISLLFMTGVIFLSYQLALNYAAHAATYQATVAASKEDFNLAFIKQEQARNLANRSAIWRRNYATTSLELAIALSNKTDITPVDQEQVLELINVAITEARAATILQPKFYQNWLVLTNVYLQLLEVTEDASQLAFESLSQAVLTSPNDPLIRMNLGLLLMRLEQWEQASNFFIQAIERKPDLAVAYYNLAQAYIQGGQILEAENALQQALILINPETDLEDYTIVEKELVIVSEQADQLRTQAETQALQPQAESQVLNLEPEIIDPGAEPLLEATEDSSLTNLLNEQETSNLLRENRLTSEEETLN
jgi:tetratricopeptide (TPR) repeat protein